MQLAGEDDSQSLRSPGWEDVHLIPTSTPEVDVAEIDLGTEFLAHPLAAPFMIASMTGGHAAALVINANLAAAAESLGIAIGTGSQRAALLNPKLVETYSVVRAEAPTAMVVGNIGMCQLIPQGDVPALEPKDIQRAIEMIEADALAVHLNAVEELIQQEGDRRMKGVLQAIAAIVELSTVPIIAKETGAGMTKETAQALAETGVAALDIGGVGGTSFARIEGTRARTAGDERGMRLGRVFADWGVPTAASIIEGRPVGLPIVATGGVRNGLHAAKALTLGATMVGIGGPAISSARIGVDEVINEFTLIIEELRVAMALVGAHDLTALRAHGPVLVGPTKDWVAGRRLTL